MSQCHETHVCLHVCLCVCVMCVCVVWVSVSIMSRLAGCACMCCCTYVIYLGVHAHGLLLRVCMHTTCILHPTATHCNTLHHTATHCNTLQHTATHFNTLQHTATHCNATYTQKMVTAFKVVCACLHTATHCNTLQHTASHCNTTYTQEMVTAFKEVRDYQGRPTKEIWICGDPPVRSANDLYRATVPDLVSLSLYLVSASRVCVLSCNVLHCVACV